MRKGFLIIASLLILNILQPWVVPITHAQNPNNNCSYPMNYDPRNGLPDNCKPTGTASLSSNDYSPTGVQGWVNLVLNILFPFLGMLSVYFIVANGADMVIYSFNDTKAKAAQKGMIWAVVGLLATILAYGMVVSFVNFVFNVTGGLSAPPAS